MGEMTPRRKRPKPGPKKNFSPDMQRMNSINACAQALKEIARRGGVSDPELAKRIEQGWVPAVELAITSIEPDLPKPMKIIILSKLMEHGMISATDQARLDAGVDGPKQISIIIANYATSGPQPTASIEPPRTTGVAALDVVTMDSEAMAHKGNSVPTPAPKEPAYQTFHVEDGNAVPDHAIPRPVEAEPAGEFETIDSYGTSYRIRKRY